jgi:hypothetical protein
MFTQLEQCAAISAARLERVERAELLLRQWLETVRDKYPTNLSVATRDHLNEHSK